MTYLGGGPRETATFGAGTALKAAGDESPNAALGTALGEHTTISMRGESDSRTVAQSQGPENLAEKARAPPSRRAAWKTDSVDVKEEALVVGQDGRVGLEGPSQAPTRPIGLRQGRCASRRDR